MEPTVKTESPAPYGAGIPDRRQRKPDLWARVFRYLTVLVYPLLILYFIIFFGFASADRDQTLAARLGSEAIPETSRSQADLYTFLPVLLLGVLVGGVGLVLNRQRARRRSDYNYRTQLVLTILSVAGLAAFFALR